MENIKEELKKIIEDVMLPETQSYLDDLISATESQEMTQDDLDAKKEIEDFIAELLLILEVIQKNKISDEDATMVYEKITALIEEHKQTH